MAHEIETFLDEVAGYLNGKNAAYELSLTVLISRLTPQRPSATARMLKFMGIKPNLHIDAFFKELDNRKMQVIENTPFVRLRLKPLTPPDGNLANVLATRNSILREALYEAERRLGK